jgi:predicted DNA-binding transcriptional regulator AlpA
MKGSALPIGYSRCVLNRECSAEYIDVSPSTFDEMVADGRMPKPVVLSERRFGWIQRELDVAAAALPRKGKTESSGACVGEMSDGQREALEDFDATRKAAKAKKSPAQH